MARLITTDGITKEVKPISGTKFSLKELQNYVGGFIQMLPLPDKSMAFCNEEGLLHNLPQNVEATSVISGIFKRPTQVFVGDVVICTPNEVE